MIGVDLTLTNKLEKTEFKFQIPFIQFIQLECQHINVVKNLLAGSEDISMLDQANEEVLNHIMSFKNGRGSSNNKK